MPGWRSWSKCAERAGLAGAGYRYILTDLGRERGQQYMDVCRYVGPGACSARQYNAYVRACMAARVPLDRDDLATGFTDLIVNQGMFEQSAPR